MILNNRLYMCVEPEKENMFFENAQNIQLVSKLLPKLSQKNV
jgi:hypothetical protein